MNPPTGRTRIFTRGRSTAVLLVGAVFGATACGGSEPSEEASSTPPASAEPAASAAAPTSAPSGTGFILMSEASELHLTEATFLEASDCTARVAVLNDAEEYAGCMEVPTAALCLQVSEGTRESDRWWECFVEEDGCEEAIAAHEVVREVGGYVREILLGCTETEMASVFASM